MRRHAALLTVVSVLAVSACGSTPLSVSQLRSDATRICQAAAGRGERLPSATSPAGAAAFLRSSAPILRQQLDNLRALTPPSQLAKTYNSAVAELAEQVRLLSATVKRLAAGADPLAAIRSLQQQLSPSEARGDAGWQQLGIPACATS